MSIENVKLPFHDITCKRLDKDIKGFLQHNFSPVEIPTVEITFIAQKL